MKITVTGYKGFIGRHVFFKLRMMGLNPIGVDKGDTVRKSDVIIHLAALMDNTYEAFVNNLDITLDVVRNTEKIVFASSAAVYGDKGKDAKEGDELEPINIYGRGKEIEELIIKAHCKEHTILRFANVYGVGNDHGAVYLFMNGENILFSKGERMRDYVYVDDVVNVLIESALSNIWDGTYNIGTGTRISSLDLFKRLNPNKKPVFKEKKEINYSCLNISKAKKNGFRPFII